MKLFFEFKHGNDFKCDFFSHFIKWSLVGIRTKLRTIKFKNSKVVFLKNDTGRCRYLAIIIFLCIGYLMVNFTSWYTVNTNLKDFIS